jgi:hypothetical protein
VATFQRSLFAVASPRCDPSLRGLERTDLGSGAWIDRRPEWVEGHETLMEAHAVPKVGHADLRISIQLRSAPVDPVPYSSS